jgi:hypothetical protein
VKAKKTCEEKIKISPPPPSSSSLSTPFFMENSHNNEMFMIITLQVPFVTLQWKNDSKMEH